MSRRAVCQSPLVLDRDGRSTADLPAQRLWLLERHAPLDQSKNHAERCHFAGAVALLDTDCIYVVIVRSHDRDAAGEQPLQHNGVRLHLERDAVKCSTLDDALAHAEEVKRAWKKRGWIESEEERCGHARV